MKTKRINAITRCVGILKEVLDRKAERINRGIEQAKADALDNSVACKEDAMEIINGLGKIAGARDTEALAYAFNSYAEKMEEADRWEALAKRFDTLKATLEEEVEIETVEK